MKKTNYDMGWLFSLNGQTQVPVNLPHDFSIGLGRAPDSRMLDKGGFFLGGNGVYRKTLPRTAQEANHRAVLEIEGAYQLAEVFVNGNLAAANQYGYSSFHAELTPWLHEGDNDIEIRVRNNALPNSRWYSGSGLYRHVWLLTAPGPHIQPWGVFAATPEVSTQQAVVQVQTEVSGAGTLRHTLLDGGIPVATCQAAVEAGTGVQQLTVKSPNLWDVDRPRLYTLRSELLAGGAVDTVETTLGIRSIALDRERGFLLNGRALKLKGGCVHHDCGILGAAAFDRAEERKVLAHKQAGFNAIRCAHNPPSPAFLDACDRHGILVMDEVFDCWHMGKTEYDYHLFFDSHWKKDLAAMVLRDRNHPCIAFWSTGNEIVERFGRSEGYAISAALAAAVREMDDTRLISNALCMGWGESGEPADWAAATADFAAPLDVAGYNYLWRRYEEDLERFPQRFVYGTETIAAEAFESWHATLANPRVIGDCVWTSLDYIGESGIGHAYLPHEDGRTHDLGYPWHLANCGDLDICCRPRAQSYYRQILWGHRTTPWIAVHRPNAQGIKAEHNYWGWGDAHHSWSWPGAEGWTTHVDVYSAADEIELFLNGVSLGRQSAGKAARNTASFQLPYAAGELRAVAWVNGVPAGVDTLATCGQPAAIRLNADRAQLKAVWGDLCYVTAEIVDAAGNLVPYADHEMFLCANGAAELVAIGSNDPVSREPYVGNHRHAHQGTLMAVLRAADAAGMATLTVAADGLKASQLTIPVEA